MRRLILFLAPAIFLAESPNPSLPPPNKFLSSIQVAVQESSPVMMQRAHNLVQEEFGNTFSMTPVLKGKRFETRFMGNEVAFVFASDEDVRMPVNAVIAQMIERLNGRVHARGRSAFYRAALTQPLGGYLEVVVDETHTKIVSVSAQSVPFRDLLKEVRAQMGGNFSYLIPGECADRPIDWSFEEGTQPIPVELAMERLALLFGLKSQRSGDTYVFSGNCQSSSSKPREQVNQPSAELLRNSLFPGRPSGATPVSYQQVFVPVLPLGE